MAVNLLSLDERKVILERAIRPYLEEGWLIQNQTETRAQLRKPAQSKSGCLIIILLLFGVLPGILYLMWPNQDRIVLVEVNEVGKSIETAIQGSLPKDESLPENLFPIAVFIAGGLLIWFLIHVLQSCAG